MTQYPAYKIKRAAYALLVFGALFLIGFIDNAAKWPAFCSDPVNVMATVTDNEQRSNYRGSPRYGNEYIYQPYVSYEVNGRAYRNIKINNQPMRHSPAPVGSTMSLMVDGKDPSKILSNPDSSSFVFAMLSFSAISIGLSMLLRLRETGDYVQV